MWGCAWYWLVNLGMFVGFGLVLVNERARKKDVCFEDNELGMLTILYKTHQLPIKVRLRALSRWRLSWKLHLRVRALEGRFLGPLFKQWWAFVEAQGPDQLKNSWWILEHGELLLTSALVASKVDKGNDTLEVVRPKNPWDGKYLPNYPSDAFRGGWGTVFIHSAINARWIVCKTRFPSLEAWHFFGPVIFLALKD